MDSKTLLLRTAVLDELALVQGRIALANKLTGPQAKEQLRLAHGAQRQERLGDAATFLATREEQLIEHFADGVDVDPAAIDPVVTPVRTSAEADLFRFATLQWSVPVSQGYGRRTRFLVKDRQNDKLIAIFALGDPVIAQSARDAAIGWTTQQRNTRLYNVYDAFILGAVEPYRQLLGGKLVALLTLANETRDFLARKYEGNTTEIRQVAKDPTPVLITTSSALGRSSIYNRITYERSLMFHSVGYTKGFGHFQFSDELFGRLLDFVRERQAQDEGSSAKGHSSKYGSGPNWRFRVLRAALDLLDIPEAGLQHNVRREVFLAPLADNWDAYLRGEAEEPALFDLPTEKIANYYRDRWATGRAERRPGFRYWRHDEARVSHLLEGHPLQLMLGARAPYGRIDLGDLHLSVGVGRERIQGRPAGGAQDRGTAYLSRLEGPSVDVTIGDVRWDSGRRDVRVLATTTGGLREVVDRLALPVQATERFRGMVSAPLSMALRVNAGVSVRVVEPSDLSAVVGFDTVEVLDRLAEASVGTRQSLLKDEGRTRRQHCVVFGGDDHAATALLWTLLRALPLLLDSDQPVRIEPPSIRRVAPRADDLELPADEATT